ncbi:DUF6252 family protein [Dokdonia sinensis]|nr:DUF6252 family protein [Dokdonia sinensis]
MKTIFNLGMVGLLILFLLSCGNDKKAPTLMKNTFTASVNGTSYEAKFASGFISPITKTLLLTGAQGDGEDIQLFLPQDIATGAYTYELPVQGKYQKTDEDAGIATEGTLVITEHNKDKKYIAGRFDFKTKPVLTSGSSATLSDGEFSVHY